MNYIKYLADARLINLVYPKGEGVSEEALENHDAQLQFDVFHLSCKGRRARRARDFLRQYFVERPQST